jgi:uncharacterized protein
MTRDLNTLDRKTVTFVVTKDCNFRCRYCYMVGKDHSSRMSFDVAKRAIDYLLEHRDVIPQLHGTVEFIGGEPLLEIDLIEKVVDHTLLRAYELDHPWFENAIFGMSTNGVLYNDPRFQRLLDRYPNRFDVGMTIDGPAHVHDRERLFPDGRGTHAHVVRNIAAWLKRFPKHSTKVTVSHDTLPFVAESILYLFSLGIAVVHANVVFENVWQPGDDERLEEQLVILGDVMVKDDLWRKHECSFFSQYVGKPLMSDNDQNWCGAGKYMLAVDAQGFFYPCVRFVGFSLAKQPAWIVGDVERGLDVEKLEPFMHLTRSGQSTQECMKCEVASGCAWCQGFNYDDSGVLAHRATHICKMHKARARANKRFWSQIDVNQVQRGSHE